MKRRKLALLIVPIILLAFVSCEGEIFSTISDFMGKTGENVLVSGGLVSVNTQQVDAVSQSIATLASDDGTLDDEKVTQVKEDLKVVLDSPQKTETLKTDLAKPIEEGSDNETVAAALKTKIDNAIEDLDLGDDFEFSIDTEADLLVATLIVDIANKVEDLDEDDEDYEEKLIQLASDALFVVEVIKAVSPTGMVDLESAVNDLLKSFTDDRSARATARSEGEDDDDFADILEQYIIPILKPVLIATDSSKNGSIEVEELKVMTRDYALMRKSYEDSAPGLVKQDGTINKQMKLSNLIDYALSVVFSTGNRLLADYESVGDGNGDKLLGFLNDVWDFIRAYENDDTTEISEYLNTDDIDGIGDAFETYSGTDAWEKVQDTLLSISRAIPKNSAVTEMLEEFFADEE